VQYSMPATKFFAVITAAMLATSALAQSGRSRPKVPQPSSTSSQPAPEIKVPAAAAVASKDQIGTTSRFVLRNGITVIVSEIHSTPIVAAVASFKASAVDEPWSMSGIARLAGRLILKGTVLRPGDSAIADLRALGASLRADTSYDGSTLSVVAPSDKIKAVLGIHADMIQNSAFDAQSIAGEIKLLAEDHKRARNQLDDGFALPSQAFSTRTLTNNESYQALSRFEEPGAYSMTRLLNLAFTGQAVLNMDSLRTVTRAQLLEFYKSHYRPDNLIISVAGDVSTFNTLVEIQQLYGDFGVTPAKTPEAKTKEVEVVKPKAPVNRPPPRSPEAQTQPANIAQPTIEPAVTVKPWGASEQIKLRYGADRSDITQSVVSAGFHVPGADSKDWPAIEVLSAVAGQGRASRLSRSLVDEQMASNRVESNYLALALSGLFTVQIWPSKEAGGGSSIDKAESALFNELDRLRRETPTDGEMARAKTLLEKRFVDESASYIGRARALARAEACGRGLRSALEYVSRIRAVTAQDIQRVAAKYLTMANTTIHEYEPLTAAARTFDGDSYATTVVAWAPEFARSVESSAVRAADATSSLPAVAQGSDRPLERQMMMESVQPLPVRDFSTLNGPRAYVREDHSRQTVTIAILFQGGRLIEEAATSGTTELMLRTILGGTARRSSSQVTQELEQLGADVRVVVEPDFFGFTLSALSRNADRALKLLRDMIEEPAFRKDDIDRARLGQLAAIRDARDSGVDRSRELLLQALYPGHPYSLPSHGREEIIAAITSEKLAEWHARAIGRQLPLAIIVGDTDGSALVSSQIAEGFKRRDTDAAIQVRTPQSSVAAEKAESRRSELSTIAIGAVGPKAGSGDLAVVHLFEAAMNGEGGRLLSELRDKQGVISRAAFGSEAMFVAGVIAAYVTTSPEFEQRARTALRGELERLARSGLTSDEMTRGRALAMTSRIAENQSQPQQALRYARAIFYRQPPADIDNFGEEVSKVTPDDVKRVAAALLKTSAGVSGSNQQPGTQPPPPPKQD